MSNKIECLGSEEIIRRYLDLHRDFPKIITLCGSRRFKEAYEKANKELTLAGNIVISVGMLGHQEGLDMDGPVKKGLDELHLRKIDLADEVFVVNPIVIVCGRCNKPTRLFTELSQETECCRSNKWSKKSYIGESTKKEIEYARSKGKIIRFLEEIQG